MIALVILLAVLLAIDWAQTLTIARTPQRWQELNPLLDAHPSPTKVCLYFAAVFVLCVIGWFYLRAPWREAAVVVGIVGELVCVINNRRLGISP